MSAVNGDILNDVGSQFIHVSQNDSDDNAPSNPSVSVSSVFRITDSSEFPEDEGMESSLGEVCHSRQSGPTVREIQQQFGALMSSSEVGESDTSLSLTSSGEEKGGSSSDQTPSRGTLIHFSNEDQDEQSAIESRAIMKTQKKHMFIMSNAGKPIYTRHSNEDNHLPLFGVMTAMMAFVEVEGDTLNSIRTRDRLFVFLKREPLIFVAISGLKDSETQLAKQLSYMYNQVVSIVSAKVLEKKFVTKSSYDLRHFLDDSGRKYLDGMCDMMEDNPSVLLGSVHCVPLKGSVRDLIGRSLVVDVNKKLVFNVLMAKNQLIQYSHMKNCMLQPSDMHILFNLVSKTGNFRDTSVEHWLPICLPGFDENGFLHALVSYLDENTCLIMLSVDREAFPELREVKDQIKMKLKKNNCFEDIALGLSKIDYTVLQTGLNDLRHFMYKQRHLLQFTCPAYSVPYDTPEERSRLFQLYKQIHHKLHSRQRNFKIVYQATDSEIILGWLAGIFEVYCCFTPLITKDDAISKVNLLVRWIRQEEDKLFLVNAYTF